MFKVLTPGSHDQAQVTPTVVFRERLEGQKLLRMEGLTRNAQNGEAIHSKVDKHQKKSLGSLTQSRAKPIPIPRKPKDIQQKS